VDNKHFCFLFWWLIFLPNPDDAFTFLSAETGCSHGPVGLLEIDGQNAEFSTASHITFKRSWRGRGRGGGLVIEVRRTASLFAASYLVRSLLQAHIASTLTGAVNAPAELSGKQRVTADSWHPRLTPPLLILPPSPPPRC